MYFFCLLLASVGVLSLSVIHSSGSTGLLAQGSCLRFNTTLHQYCYLSGFGMHFRWVSVH